MERFIALDTETTGVDFCSSQVIQCGVIFLDEDKREIDRKEWNINFRPDEFSWDDEAEAVHGIPKDEAKVHGVEPEIFLKELERSVVKHYGNAIPGGVHIIAANAHFDFIMLERLWKKYRQDELPLSRRMMDISTLSLAILGSSGLSRVMDELGIAAESDRRHSALYDAELHLKVFYALITVAKEEGGNLVL